MPYSVKYVLVVCLMLMWTAAASADDLRIQGFLSVGVAQMDTDEMSIRRYDDELNFKNRNVFGVQLSKPLNDMVSVTGQLVARGVDDYDVEATWAYVTIAPTDNDSIRVGRLRVPFFYYSDFLEVGYAYNWASPPSIVYRIGFNTIDAVDYTRSFDFGDTTGSVQLYYGRWNDDLNLSSGPAAFDLTKFFGVVGNLSWENLSFRLSYHSADLTAPTVGFDEDTSTFAEAAVVYDDGDNFAVFEYTALDHDSLFLLDNIAYMVSYARRINSWTIHGTYSYYESDVEEGFQQTLDDDSRTGYTLGARWDFADSTALKLEAQYQENQNYDAPLFGEDGKKTTGTLYTIGMDMIF